MRTEIAIISALALVLSVPVAFGEIVETKGQNYDLIENFFIGEAVWESHPERIMDGGWQNYALSNGVDKVIFNTNAVGSFIFDKNSCSYSIYGNGYNGEQIIPSVSAVATYLNNGQWQNLPINDEACTVTVEPYEDGVFLTSTKVISEDITEDVFIPYTGTTENFYVNATNANFDLIQSSNGTNTGYFNGETRVIESVPVESFVQEIRLDIRDGFKETFKVIHDGNQELGISQTIHTGESITIGETVIDIAELNGQSFDRQFITDNQAEILAITDSVNYDFDTGIESLSNVNIIFDGDYKVNMDFSEGNFVGYLEIDPTFGYTSGTVTRSASVNVSSGDNCDTISGGSITDSVNEPYVVSGSRCYPAFYEFDTSSISDSSVITDVSFRTDVTSTGTGTDTLDIYKVPNAPSTRTANELYDDYKARSTDYISNDNFALTTGTQKTLDLGNTANTDVQNLLSSDYYAIGIFYNNPIVSTTQQWKTLTNTEIQITYTVPITPQPPTGLTTVTGIPLELDWDSPQQSVNYKIHTFTSTGTFQVTAGSGNVDTLIVAGGGGGGGNHGSGGGAGGVIFKPNHAVTAQSYTATIGTGGAGGASNGANAGTVGTVGNDSSFDGLVSKGGGFGGTWNNVGSWTSGGDGGSGGGGLVGNGGSDGVGIQTSQSGDSGTYGFGNSPLGGSTGYNGGAGSGDSGSVVGIGGSGIGGTINSDINDILIHASAGVLDGTDRYISAGGNSAWATTAGSPLGGGGVYLGGGATNTGSGGGGGCAGSCGGGGDGGDGIIIVRYIDDGSITATGGTVTTIAESNGGNGGSAITGYKVFRTLNEFALTELPDSSGSDSQITFTDNEFLLHGFEDVISTVTPTADDFSSYADVSAGNAVWSSENTSYTYVDTTNDRLYVNQPYSTGVHAYVARDMGANVVDSDKWVAQWKMNVITAGTSSIIAIGFSDSDETVSSNTVGDHISFAMNRQANPDSVLLASSSIAFYGGTTTVSNSFYPTINTDYWYELIRDGSTATVNIFSDSTYSTLEGTATSTITTTGDLRYFKIGNVDWDVTTSVGDYTAQIDDWKFYNGVSSTTDTLTTTTLTDKSTNSISNILNIQPESMIPVTWDSSNTVDFSISGNTLTRSSGTYGWNNYAVSTNTYNPSTGGGEFEFTATGDRWIMGFDTGAVSTSNTYAQIDYAIFVNSQGTPIQDPTGVIIYENGVNKYSSGYAVDMYGDTFKSIMDSNGVVTYYRNNVLFYTSTQTASGDYNINASEQSLGGTATVNYFGSPVNPTASTTGVIDTGLQSPDLSFTDSNLPDGTDDFSVGSWVKLDYPQTFEDDFSTDNWTDWGSGSPISVDTTSGVLDFEVIGNDQSNDIGSQYDLTSVSDTAFILDFDYSITNIDLRSSGSAVWIYLGLSSLDNNGTNEDQNTQDYVGIYSQISNANDGQKAIAVDNASIPEGDGDVFDLAEGDTWYMRYVRDGNSMDITWYSDSVRTNVQATKTLDVTDISDLRYFVVRNYSSGSTTPNGEITGSIDNVLFYDGVTSIPSEPNTKLLGLNDVTFNVGTDSASVVENESVTSSAWHLPNNGMVTMPSSSFNTGTGDFTWAMWVKHDSSSSSEIIMKRTAQSNDAGWGINWHSTNGISYFMWDYPTQWINFNSGASGLVDGQWYHGVVTRDNGLHTLYIDGVTQNTASTSHSANYNYETRILGNPVGYNSGTWSDGTVSDLAHWNRALSANEVQTIYAGAPTDISSGLQNHYNFEQTGSTLEDQVGTLDGSLSGTKNTETGHTTIVTNTIISASSITDNTVTPQHYSFVRDGNNWAIYQNGVSQATATDTTSLGSNGDSTLISDDFTTDNWTDSSKMYVQNGILYADGIRDGTNYSIHRDLGEILEDDFVFRSEVDITSLSVGSVGYGKGVIIGLSDTDDSASDATLQDSVSLYLSFRESNGNGFYGAWSDNAYMGGSGSTRIGTEPLATGLWYIEIAKTGGSVTYSLYSDSSYSTLVASVTNTGVTAEGLQYVVLRNENGSSSTQAGNVEVEIDDMTITQSPPNYTTNISGMIDEYFVNSDVLTATEIDDIYDRGVAPTLLTTTGASTTEHDDSTVVGGNTYYFTLKSTNAIGDSDFLTPFVSGLAGTPADPPSSVSSGINSPNTAPLDITVSWSSPTNVGSGTLTGFEIYRDSVLIDTTGLVTSYTDTVPSGGGTFEYKLKSLSTHGTSGFSGTTSTTTPTVPPTPTATPTLAINNPNPSPLDIDVSWTAQSSGGSTITGYEIFRSADDITFTSVGTVTDLDFTDTVPSAGTWYYTFASTNLVGSSGQSPSNSITTATVPSSPLNASSVIPSINSAPYDVTVSWELPTSTGGSDLTGYNVYRQTGSGAFSLITTTTALGYVDTVPTALNQDYTFKIHSLNNVGESTAFVTTTITTGDVPDAPVLSSTTGTTSLSWTVPSSDASITGYEIYRDTVLLTTVTTTTHSDFTTINFGQSYAYDVKAVSSLGSSVLSNTIISAPETEITGMIAQGITGTGAVIDWDEPAYYQGQITNYEVYYSEITASVTTPTTSAGTTTNTYSNFAPNLDYDTTYIFGVKINSPLGNSGFSNYVTVTTSVDGSIVAFDPTVGGMEWFDIDSVNEQTVSVIQFQRETQDDMVNGTNIVFDTLQVAYPSWWDDMTCDVDYKFAQKTEQYVEGEDMTSLVNPSDANQQIIGFQFHDIDNEVIEVECAPQQSQQDDGVSAKYVMTQNSFGTLQADGTYSTGLPNIPLVTQITNFTSGEYGTDGDFGAVDIVGLFVILVSMVGFNRVSPIVGVLISASTIFALSFFGLIAIPTIIVGAIALVIFLAWGIHRKR